MLGRGHHIHAPRGSTLQVKVTGKDSGGVKGYVPGHRLKRLLQGIVEKIKMLVYCTLSLYSDYFAVQVWLFPRHESSHVLHFAFWIPLPCTICAHNIKIPQ